MLKKLFSLVLTLGLIQILPIVEFANIPAFLISVVVLGFLLYFIEPVLKLFSLPLIVATFGFFRFVLLTGSIWLTTFLVPGFIIYPMIFFGTKVPYIITLIFVSIIIRSVHSFICKLLRC